MIAEENVTEMLTVSQVADLLRIHKKTVYRWSKKGTLNPIEFPKKTLRFYKSEVEKILKNGV